jgi:hypothetical protein
VIGRAAAIAAVLFLGSLVLGGCSGGDGDAVDAEALHARILEAFESAEVRHVAFTFQEAEDRPVEQHEVWIHWANERARLEQQFPGLRLGVTVVADGQIDDGDSKRAIGESDLEGSFAEAVFPGTHLFRWLVLPSEAFREPVRRLDDEGDGVERYRWTAEYGDADGSFCGVITLEVDAEISLPIRSYAEACPEIDAPSDARGFVTEYELSEEVPRSSVAADAFELDGGQPVEREVTPTATALARVTIAGIEVGPAVRAAYPQCGTAPAFAEGSFEEVVGTPLDLLPTFVPEGAQLAAEPMVTVCDGQPVSVRFDYRVDGGGEFAVGALLGLPRFEVDFGLERVSQMRMDEDERGALIIPPVPGDERSLVLIREPWGLTTFEGVGVTAPDAIGTAMGMAHGSSRLPFALDAVPTGIGSMDAVIDAVTTGDVGALLGLVAYFEVECRLESQPSYDPSCESLGVPEGTVYEAISAGGCDVGALPRDRVRDVLAGLLADMPVLYGVYREVGGAEPRYGVLFVDPPPSAGWRYEELQIEGGGITALLGSCGAPFPAENAVDHWIVPPPTLGYDPTVILGPVVGSDE